jgi:ABC-type Fe3+-hydroxamate transport system substrate-binding protein
MRKLFMRGVEAACLVLLGSTLMGCIHGIERSNTQNDSCQNGGVVYDSSSGLGRADSTTAVTIQIISDTTHQVTDTTKTKQMVPNAETRVLILTAAAIAILVVVYYAFGAAGISALR